jgi:ankyrin repeat protein
MMTKRRLFILTGLFLAVFPLLPQETGEAPAAFPPRAVIIAAYRGDEKMVREILAAGPDTDIRDALGATALHAAMYQSNLTVVKLLLDHGFDPNAQDTRHGHTPLHIAVIANNTAAARLLIQYQADRNIRNMDRHTPLEKARIEGKTEMVRVLVR